MKRCLRRWLAFGLSELLLVIPYLSGGAPPQSPAPASRPETSLRDYLQKPYVELFELAPKLRLTPAEFQALRDSLKKGEDVCIARFKGHAKQYDKQIDQTRADLKRNAATITQAQRKQTHCTIQNLDLLKSEALVLSQSAIPTAYDNLAAKLDLLERWPALYAQTQEEISTDAYLTRRWGDVKDIGFRKIEDDQADDIKKGQQAIDEMKRAGLMPPDLQDEVIQSYVDSVAQRVAKYSDLKIPLHIRVLQSREINAFALPGGYLFIDRGLLEATDDESELAGVLAHEMSHDAARHANKLLKRATIASIFYQAAQLAATVLTGGAAGIGAYYAIQYGFYGLGLILNLNLLGVSREYELEADQLGVQYAWNAGYDPSGFIRFFDKMATRQGYIQGVSWFRTHPPFYQRMVSAQREILFMPPKSDLMIQTSAFEQMKARLAPIAAAAEKEEVGKPSLLIKREEGCEPPKKLEYTPGQSVENLCSSTPRSANNSTNKRAPS